jgi:hypothetical protein
MPPPAASRSARASRSSRSPRWPPTSPIIGGILVFHEPIGSGTLATTARFLAFCLVIAGAALMPAQMRATADTA